MIAPEPFFEPRGTPFSEYHRIRALLELGQRSISSRTRSAATCRCRGCACSAACVRRSCTRVGIGPSLAKMPLDLALTLTALRARLPERYDAVHSHEEGSFIGIVLAALLGVPHRLRHALEPAAAADATSRSAARDCSRARSTWMERFVIRRSRVVIVICPHLEERARGRPGVPTVLIENAPGSGDTPVAGSARAVAASAGDAGRGAAGALHRNVRGVPGARSAVRRGAHRPGGAAGRAVRARRRAARSDRSGAGRRRRAAGHRRRCDLRRPAARRGDPALSSMRPTCSSRRAARGTNTPLKIYQYLRSGRADRRDAPAHAHAGAGRRRGVPDARRRRRVRRRHPRGASAIPERGARGRRARAAARRNEVQLRGVPGADAPGLRAPQRAPRAPRWPGASRDARRRSAPHDHYSYYDLRRPGDGGSVRRAALQRSDRPADRRDAGAGDRSLPRRRSRAEPCSTWGPAPGAPPSRWRARGARDGRGRVGGDAARSRAASRGRQASASRSRRATRTRSTFADAVVRRGRLPARADAHARLAASRSASCAASRGTASCSTTRRWRARRRCRR